MPAPLRSLHPVVETWASEFRNFDLRVCAEGSGHHMQTSLGFFWVSGRVEGVGLEGRGLGFRV